MASNSDASAPSEIGLDRQSSICLLCVDDDLGYRELMVEMLRQADGRFDINTAASGKEGLKALAEGDVDCIVSDYDMPGMDGLEFLEAVRKEYPDLPFVLFTGKGSEEIASKAISAGVNDYLQKKGGIEQFELLANRVTNLLDKRRAEVDLRTRLHQQKFVAELGQDALAGAELQTLYDRAVAGVAEALDTDYAKVLEYRAGHDDLLLRAGVGWEDGHVGEETVDAGYGSQAGYTLQAEEPVIVEDLRNEQRFSGPSLLVEHDVKSGISVRIGDRDDPWGVFGVHTTEVRRFDADDVTFVQSVVNVLASAVRRREQERDLRSFRQAVDHAGHAIYCTERDGTIRYVNPAAEEMTGYTSDETIGTTPRLLQSGEHDEEFYQELWETILGGEVWQDRLVNERKDGTRYVVNQTIAPIEGDDGEIERFVAVNSDVTEHEERERELRRLKNRFETLFEELPDMVFIHDEEGTIRRANAKACEKLGYDGEELEGKRVWEISHDLDPDEAIEFWRNLSPEETPMFESVHERKDGSTFPVEIHITLLDNGPREFLTVVRDFTTRKEREHRLQERTEQLDLHNQRLEEFVDVLSHDVPNHLDVAQTRLDLARQTDGPGREHLEAIETAHERITTIFSDMQTLLEQGREIGDEERSWLRLSALLEDCWSSCCPGESGGSVELDSDGFVRASESRFKQLLENLFWNACEHGGDDVTVRVGVTAAGFYVADDGPGIPETERENVLAAGYSTAKNGHSGFGLAIVREVGRVHGWRVRVAESEDGGARFEFDLPTTDVRHAE